MIDTMKDKLSVAVDVDSNEEVLKILRSCVNSNEKWGSFLADFAVKAVKQVATFEDGRAKVDVKRYIKVEKIPGGLIEDSKVLNGVMFNKDVVHPKMSRRIEKPRVVLMDCGLEYKKGESVTNMEFSAATDFTAALQVRISKKIVVSFSLLCRTTIFLHPLIMPQEAKESFAFPAKINSISPKIPQKCSKFYYFSLESHEYSYTNTPLTF